MNAADHVIMLSLGRGSDPLLDDLIAAEGYDVVHVESGAEALRAGETPTCAAVAVLYGDQFSRAAAEFLKAAPSRLPGAKFIIFPPNGMAPLGSDVVSGLPADRVLWLQGETCGTGNVQRIRGFLRGEGYAWASELEADLAAAPLLETAGRFGDEGGESADSILRFAGDLSRFTELRPMLREALDRYLEILDCGAGSVYLWDEDTETLVLEAAEGPEAKKRLGIRQRLGEGLAGWVAKVGEPILVTDSRKVHKLRGRTCRRYDNFSIIALPIMHGGQLFGVVCLTMPRAGRAFGPEDLRLARNLSQKLAAAIRPLTVLSDLRRFSERLLGAFKSSSDLAMEKDAEVEALRDLSRSILDNVPLAVVSYDAELRVRSANVAARRAFDIAPVSAGGSRAVPLEDGIEMDRALWRQKLRHVIEEGRKFRLQRVGFVRGEKKRVLDIHCSPLKQPDGRTMTGILTVQDVTEDVEMENKLQSAERLALVGKIAAKVAHELNNPLDGILRFLSLAMRQIDRPDQAKQYLVESRQGLLRMGYILSELLAFSRSHYAAHRPMSLSQVIHQSLAPYEPRAREANIAIELQVPPDLPLCPSNDVWEVMGNVIKNALDAIGKDGRLRIAAEAEDRSVRIRVADTGPGVPPDLQERIFEPFFTTKKEGASTGLGLAVCRDALRRIGGDIRVAPSEVGATFEITVPIRPNPTE